MDDLLKKHKFSPNDVQKIEVGVNEAVTLHSGTIYEPTEVIEAQFSLRFSLALRILKGGNDFESTTIPSSGVIRTYWHWGKRSIYIRIQRLKKKKGSLAG